MIFEVSYISFIVYKFNIKEKILLTTISFPSSIFLVIVVSLPSHCWTWTNALLSSKVMRVCKGRQNFGIVLLLSSIDFQFVLRLKEMKLWFLGFWFCSVIHNQNQRQTIQTLYDCNIFQEL